MHRKITPAPPVKAEELIDKKYLDALKLFKNRADEGWLYAAKVPFNNVMTSFMVRLNLLEVKGEGSSKEVRLTAKAKRCLARGD